MGQCIGSKSSTHAVTDKQGEVNRQQDSGAASVPPDKAARRKRKPRPSKCNEEAPAVDPKSPHTRSPSAAAVAASHGEGNSGNHGTSPSAGALNADISAAAARDYYISNDHSSSFAQRNPTVFFESVIHRIEQGSTYVWLTFSHANPHMTAEPLVRSRRQEAVLTPYGEKVCSGKITISSASVPSFATDIALTPNASATEGEENRNASKQVQIAGTNFAYTSTINVSESASGPEGNHGNGVTSSSGTAKTAFAPVAVAKHGSELVVGTSAVLIQAPALPVNSSFKVTMGDAVHSNHNPTSRGGEAPPLHSCDVDLKFYEAVGLTAGSVLVRRPGEIRGRRFTIQSCTRAAVLLLDLCSGVSVSQCENCFLFIGPTLGTIDLEQCHGCVVVAACGQVRLKRCHNMVLSLLTAGLPMLENSTAVGLTALSGWYAYNEMPLHLRSAHLSPFINNYTTVRDLTPPPKYDAAQALGRKGLQAGRRQPPRMTPATAANQLRGTRRKNFYYLDPWDFDLVLWRFAVATALRNRGLSRSVSFSVDRQLTAPGVDSVAAPAAFATRSKRKDPVFFSDLSRKGNGDDGSSGSFRSAVTAKDDEPIGAESEGSDSSSAAANRDGEASKARNMAKMPVSHVKTSRRRGKETASPTLAFPEESFNVEEARAARDTLLHVPLRLLDLPVATMNVTESVTPSKSSAAAEAATPPGADRVCPLDVSLKVGEEKAHKKGEDADKKAKQHQQQPLATRVTTLQLPPLSPRCVEDMLGLYTGAMVAPTTLGACCIPKNFFKEKWRLKLFVVTNKNGGWSIAQRVARDIELSRRQVFFEYARTVPAARRGKGEFLKDSQDTLLSAGRGTGEAADRHKGMKGQNAEEAGDVREATLEDPDLARALEHHYIPLVRRCGPVLLLNTVELRCTETVMREYVAPTFYKLTEPPEVAQQQQQQQQHRKKGEGDGSHEAPHKKKTLQQKQQDEEELRRGVAIRRLFGEAIQRMSGQTCVFFLALIAPPDKEVAPTSAAAATATAQAPNNAATAAVVRQNRKHDDQGELSDGDSDSDVPAPIGDHEVGNDNSLALSRFTRRTANRRRNNNNSLLVAEDSNGSGTTTERGGVEDRHKAGVTRTQARRLNGFHLFQPLSRDEEADDRHAQPGSCEDEEEEEHATAGGVNERSAGEQQPQKGDDSAAAYKSRNKRIDKKKTAAVVGQPKGAGHDKSEAKDGGKGKTAGFAPQELELEKSTEEQVWPRCVLLNVTVPLSAVSLLQSNVFFKAAITSASTSGGFSSAPPGGAA